MDVRTLNSENFCLLRCVTHPKFAHFLYCFATNSPTHHQGRPRAPFLFSLPLLFAAALQRVVAPLQPRGSNHQRLTPPTSSQKRLYDSSLSVSNGSKQKEMSGAQKRRIDDVKREINVERRPVMDQWDLCFSRLFGLLLILSSSKSAKIKPLTVTLRFSFRISSQLEEEGGWRMEDGLQRRRLVHRQLTVTSGCALGNNDSEKHL